MESIFLEFQFLDLYGVSNEDVQSLLEHLRPGTLVSAVQLPWSVTKVSEIPEKEILSPEIHVQQLPSSYLPNSNVPSSNPNVPIVTESVQFSANAPIFIPAGSVPPIPTNIGVPPSPFTGIPPQNMQQFPPQFMRPPFTMSASYAVPLDSASNHVHHQINRRDSPTNRHHYHQNQQNPASDYDDNHENNRGQILKPGRHYSNDTRHNPRKSNSKKKNNHHPDNNAVDPMNVMGNQMDYGARVTHIMTEEVLHPVVSDLSSPDRNMNSMNAPQPNMVPMPPFPVTISHATYQTAQIPYQPPPQVYFYHPYGYMQPGSNSPVLPNMPVVEGENIMVANVTGPPPGLYEGSPLTMTSHAPMNVHQTHHQQMQQHHSQQIARVQTKDVQPREHAVAPRELYPDNSGHRENNVVENIEMEIPSSRHECETDNREIPNNSTLKDSLTNDKFERDLEILPEKTDHVAVNIEHPNENIEQLAANVGNFELEREKNDRGNKNELSSERNIDSKATSFESSDVKERTITPELAANNLEDSGVDVGVETPPLATPPVAPKATNEPNRRWSDLFKGNGASSGGVATIASKPPSLSNATQNGHSNDDFANDFDIQKIGRILQSYKVDFKPQPFTPRGLINRSNWCYINATLQALLVCAPFHNLIKTLQSFPTKAVSKGKTPIMFSLASLMSEFENSTGSKRKKNKEDLNIGYALEPVCMHTMLSMIKSECIKGRQEDAEEFLSCILNGLHDEMVAIIKTVAPPERNKGCNGQQSLETNGHLSGDEGGDDEWRMMGPKGKGSGTVTRTSAHLSPTPVKTIFGGMTRSLLTSGTESSATLQPFFTLQLDIQGDGVESVEDALSHLIVKEAIQGYTCSKTKKEVEASRCMTLEELPPVLILHFKRFVYDDKDGGSKKVLKKMDYPLDLELKKDLLSTGVRQRFSAKYRNYRLFAVVYHDGKEAVKGHYVADVFHAGINGWLHCDDRNIKAVSETDVLTYNSPCVPYLLFYGREPANQATPE